MKFLFFLICVAYIFSIGCTSKNNVADIIQQMKSAPIIFPDNVLTMYNGRDTNMREYKNTRLKLVLYIDSTTCNTCFIDKLYLWKDLFDFRNQFNEELSLYFLLESSSSTLAQISFSLRKQELNYPIRIDTLFQFSKLNTHIPTSPVYHTFLLDKDNKVLMVGNPMTNKKMEKLFMEVVNKNCQQSIAK